MYNYNKNNSKICNVIIYTIKTKKFEILFEGNTIISVVRIRTLGNSRSY